VNRILALLLLISCFPSLQAQKTGTFKDPRDGKVYKTVTIGKQTWLGQNLAFKADSGFCPYEFRVNNIAVFGYLYNYETAKNVCPAHWHLPTNDEWSALIDYAGGQADAGNKLKETGTDHWSITHPVVTNELGFDALPGGCRKIDGTFFAQGNFGNWWSATEESKGAAWDVYMTCGNGFIGRDFSLKNYYFSVRCVRD
jgi:uncharacterized protein (TIGR02145 family)